MKKIEAVIRPHLLEVVRDALQSQGVFGMTITSAYGSSRGAQPRIVYRAATYQIAFVQMVKLELVLDDDDADAALATIFRAARTGSPGDGKVWVSSLDSVARIRTGEWNANAV